MKTIDFEVTIENYANDIRKLYSLLRPNANPEAIRCEDFDVGIMNKVVKMDDPDSNDPIVLRIFQLKSLETMSPEEREKKKRQENRGLEVEAFRRAGDLGIAPKLCATFRNGFVYPFVDGDMLTAEIYDFEIAKKIAAKVAKLHRLDLGAMARQRPDRYWEAYFGGERDQAEVKKERDFFDQKMRESEFEEYRDCLPSFTEICVELERIHEILLEKNAYGPVCFLHNDLNITNVIVKKNKEPVLLDFEWANTGYQMYDFSGHLFSVAHRLGHFFNPGVPSEEFMKNWLRGYYEEANETNLNGRLMAGNHFEEFIDNELKKVQANTLFIRLLMIRMALQFTLKNTGQIPIERGVKYAIDLYNDYKANRDKHLLLLDTLRTF